MRDHPTPEPPPVNPAFQDAGPTRPVFTRDDLLKYHSYLCDQARDLMVDKNSDYAKDESPFRNLESTPRFTRVTTEEGIIIRLGDKLSRLGVLLDPSNTGPKVKDESIKDTIKDGINYLVLLAAYLESKK